MITVGGTLAKTSYDDKQRDVFHGQHWQARRCVPRGTHRRETCSTGNTSPTLYLGLTLDPGLKVALDQLPNMVNQPRGKLISRAGEPVALSDVIYLSHTQLHRWDLRHHGQASGATTAIR